MTTSATASVLLVCTEPSPLPTTPEPLRPVPGVGPVAVAWLHIVSPSLTDVLVTLVAHGPVRVVVYRPPGSPNRASWVRRVLAHHVRAHAPRYPVTVCDTTVDDLAHGSVCAAALGGGRTVTGREAPLHSPAWEDLPGFARHVLVCRGPRCSARGAPATVAALTDRLAEHHRGDDDVLVTVTGCLFPCNHAPVVAVYPDDVWYADVDPERARSVVDEHLVGGTPATAGRLPRAHGPRPE